MYYTALIQCLQNNSKCYFTVFLYYFNLLLDNTVRLCSYKLVSFNILINLCFGEYGQDKKCFRSLSKSNIFIMEGIGVTSI